MYRFSVIVIVVSLLKFCLAVNPAFNTTQRNTIRLVDNGYEDILIAIGESVPASESVYVKGAIKVSILSTYKHMRLSCK